MVIIKIKGFSPKQYWSSKIKKLANFSFLDSNQRKKYIAPKKNKTCKANHLNKN